MGPGGLIHASELFLIAAYVVPLDEICIGHTVQPQNYDSIGGLHPLPFASPPLTIQYRTNLPPHLNCQVLSEVYPAAGWFLHRRGCVRCS